MATEGTASPSSGSKSRDTRGQAPSQDQVRERVKKEAGKESGSDTASSDRKPKSQP
jgi:hypothetical protein